MKVLINFSVNDKKKQKKKSNRIIDKNKKKTTITKNLVDLLSRRRAGAKRNNLTNPKTSIKERNDKNNNCFIWSLLIKPYQ